MPPLHRIASRLLFPLLALVLPAAAADPALVRQLAAGEGDERIEALGKLTAQPDPLLLPLLEALAAGNARVAGARVLVLDASGAARDAATGDPVGAVPADVVEPVVNNRMRGVLAGAIAALRLSSPNRSVRLESAKAIATDAEASMLPHIDRALAVETDGAIRELLALARATVLLASPDKAARLEAVKTLGESNDSATRTLLLALLEKKGDGFAEPDEQVRIEAQRSVHAIQSRLARGEWAGRVFTGLSLGSILLLAALGLAITYGVMGVINMAHGELLMIGAYATYAVQGLFRTHYPGLLDWYLLAAVPVAFAAAALVGMAMERTVIRFLYGRPLETLLATWGLSLVLIQASRVIFGAQNVEVANPAWMSGGIHFLSNVVLPWNRIVIIGFSVGVLLLVWALLNRTRLGMFVRAVTQNRPMAGCVGVPTSRIDTLAFGLGAGIAGLGGVALSQVSNVGPDMGQSYIVDSFMVVVLGGVGQLAGAVWAALGLGVATKFLEGWTGAVIAKILVLVFIIVFIQKRPQGLFALKGRFADA